RAVNVDDAARGDDAASEPDCRAVHRRDDWRAAPDHVRHDLPALAERVTAQHAVLRHPIEEVEVAAGAERPALTGDHRDAGVRVRGELRKDPGQRAMQRVVGGVELLGTRAWDPPAPPFAFYPHPAPPPVLHPS